MIDLTLLRGAFQIQANFCRHSGSPVSAAVLEAIATRIDRTSLFGAALRPWFEADHATLFGDVPALRLIGAFHYLVLSGKAPGLAAFYADEAGAPATEDLAEALEIAARDHFEVIESFMASPPQTNEVTRALCLVGGFLTVAHETGLPLRCLELGASAGLNMNWDRFGYRFGEGARWGDPAAAVQLSGEWEGCSPPTPAVLTVVERAGCDQNPIDVTDEDRAFRLQSYVWAGQALRMQRLRAALALKRATGGVPERADAADWAEKHADPKPGVATVVYHSVFIQYPPKDTQARIIAAIEAGGALATKDAPLAWLRMEPDPNNLVGPMEVRLTVWPSGEERLLALVHPHGAQVKWLT